MSVPAGFKGLRFPCECVSSLPGGYSDPWAEITKNKLLPNGTKEEILNVLAQRPNTITQIAETLGLSAPSIHTHVRDMLRSDLLREAVEWRKRIPRSATMNRTFQSSKLKNAQSSGRSAKRRVKSWWFSLKGNKRKSNVPLLKLVFTKKAGRHWISRSVCSRMYIAARALCWNNADCYRLAGDTQMAHSGIFGRRRFKRTGARSS